MATSTHSKTSIPTFDAAFDRAGEAGEQFASAARKAGNLYLDTYEKAVDRTVELERRIAHATQQAWLRDLIEAQADFTRELAGSYTSTARTLLK